MMNYLRLSMTCLSGAFAFVLLILMTQNAHAVVADSTYTTSIQVQGEAAGTEFDDWAGIPVAYTDPVDNSSGWLDINTVQIANDNDNIYIHVTTHNTLSIPLLNLHLAIDTDQDTATGYDLFDVGIVGSELGYQTDFPFQQATGLFNTGIQGIAEYDGDFLSTTGYARTFPFWDTVAPAGTQIEWAIPRDLAIGPTLPGTPVFTGSSFNFAAWVEEGLSDITDEEISYTLAAAPAIDGDFDGDLDVDGADFLIWQREFGSTLFASDLTDWRNNFGPAAATAAISAVPEPGCITLSAMALLGLLYRKPRCQVA